MHPLTLKLLENRGIVDPQAQQEFLYPDYDRDIKNPLDIIDMEKAARRVLLAMEEGQEIVIFGDYDCDGIPGSVVLHDLFAMIGYENVRNYIPHRHHEGYGLSVAAAEKFIKEDVNLIITVDCGITDVAAVELLQGANIDVIVTDHHLPGPVLPPAYAIVNSKRPECTYHDNMLCGAGVAFKLAQAVLKLGSFKDIPNGREKWLLDMAGLSTIADMVPLVKENRALAYFGLKVLRKSPRPGLQAMLREAKVDQRYLTETDVGFTIAPRVNAASRMAEPIHAFHTLAARDPGIGADFARELEQLNTKRKEIGKEMEKRAVTQAESLGNRPVIVVGDNDWTVGVAGIIASKLVERFKKPVFVWCKETSGIKGSCRSDGTVNLVTLMHAVQDGVFAARGGHALAGGFSVFEDKLGELEDALCGAYESLEKSDRIEKVYEPEIDLNVSDVNYETFNAISMLAPFGEGNPRPVVALSDVDIVSAQAYGKTKEHLKVVIRDKGGAQTEALAWYKLPENFNLVAGQKRTIIAHIEESRFLGRVSLRLQLLDVI
jgi:single-stranded-DNA-specific exonuclease